MCKGAKNNKPNYLLKLRQFRNDAGESWEVTAQGLDPHVFYGTGDSVGEAVEDFWDAWESISEIYEEKGVKVPQPREAYDEKYSGRFLIRTTPRIHRFLAEFADEEQLSLNALLNQILVQSRSEFEIGQRLEETLKAVDTITRSIAVDRNVYNVRFTREQGEESYEYKDATRRISA